MEKIRIDINKAMIREFYTDIVRRCIGYYLMKDFAEIHDSLILESKNLSQEVMWKIKPLAFFEILKTDRCKKVLLFNLDSLIYKRDDIVEQILVRYGISKKEESTLYHDELKMIFSDFLNIFSGLIKQERVQDLYNRYLYDIGTI